MSSWGDPIDALFAPRSVAVVGASPKSYVGRILCENLKAIGFAGPVYPVNPRYEEVLGWRCYPSLEELPEAPDAVVAAVRIDMVAGVLRSAAKLGARASMVPGGGFTETGPVALRAHEDIAAVAREFGMAVCGPNCMGVIAPGRASAMYIGTVPKSLLPGSVALVSQSGSVVEAAVNMGPRIGFSALVSCGVEAGATVGQYLRYFAQDAATRAVALFLEGFRDPAGFVAGAKAMRRAGKPLAVLQAGRSTETAPAVAAHSGALAGADEVVTGLLHQIGAIGVDDLDELFELSELLGHGRLPEGRRMFVVTDSGGEANLVGDHARWTGLELPPPSVRLREQLQARWPNFSYIGNPIDPWGVDPDYETLYGEIWSGAAEEDVDVLCMALDKVTTWAGEHETELGVSTARSLIRSARASGKFAAYFTLHATGPAATEIREPLRAAGVPLMHGMRPALVALRRAWWWNQWRPRTPLPDGEGPVPLAYGEPGPMLSELASRDIMSRYGIPLVPVQTAATEAEAVAAAEGLGYPVVIKADVAGVAHKAAAGFVATGVYGRKAVRDAFRRVVGATRAAGAAGSGVLVEATARGLELIAGMRHDPVFGPVVLMGVGGTMTEVLKDVAVRTCPIAREDLEEMLEECAVGRLLQRIGADPGLLQAVVAALSRLALDHPEIREVDVNPLFVDPQGTMAADALVVLADGDSPTRTAT